MAIPDYDDGDLAMGEQLLELAAVLYEVRSRVIAYGGPQMLFRLERVRGVILDIWDEMAADGQTAIVRVSRKRGRI